MENYHIERQMDQHWGHEPNNAKEVLYIHLQKRAMKDNGVNTSHFYIYPNEFVAKPKKYFSEFGLNPNYVSHLKKRLVQVIKRMVGIQK